MIYCEKQISDIFLLKKNEGDFVACRDTDFYYLWPDDALYEGNDDSLVLYMRQRRLQRYLQGIWSNMANNS